MIRKTHFNLQCHNKEPPHYVQGVEYTFVINWRESTFEAYNISDCSIPVRCKPVQWSEMQRGEMRNIISGISYTCSWLVKMSTIKKVYQKQSYINILPLTMDDACFTGLELGAILVLLHYNVICFLLSICLTMIYNKSSTPDSYKTPLFQSRNVIWYIALNSATTQGNIKRFDGFTSMKDAASAFYLLTSPAGTRSSSFHKI